jgi:hypothetical protein
MSKDTIIYNFISTPISQPVYDKQLVPNPREYRSLPATIVGIDNYENLQCVDVKISIDDLYVPRNNLVQEGIVLKKKFVSLLNSGGFSIQQPVSIGDPVRLCWANKSIGQYLEGNGGNVTVSVSDLAELDDCWVELVGGTYKNNANPSSKNLIIQGPETKITITPEGKIDITTSGESYLKSSKHTVDTDMEITGELRVKGMSYHESGIFASTYAGLAGLSAPATFEVDMNITGDIIHLGSFTINGKSIDGHDHNGEVTAF